MSLIRNLVRIQRLPQPYGSRCAIATVNQRASFHWTGVRAVGKEDTLHMEGRAEEVEKRKQDHLKKQEEGKGHWEAELASNSEEAVKADRGDITASDDDIKKLQEETTQFLKKENNSEKQ